MGFFFFLLVTAVLLIRPSELVPELRSVHVYEITILLCLVFSLSPVLQQFSLRSLVVRPITLCLFGLLPAVALSQLAQGNIQGTFEQSLAFLKIVIYYLLLVANITNVVRLRIFIICLGVFSVVCVSLAVLQYHDILKLPEPEPELVLNVAGRPQPKAKDKGAYVVDKEYDPVAGQMVEFRRLRSVGIFADPNDLSLLLTMGIFIAVFGLTDRVQGALRLGWLGPLLFLGYALLLTQSRGGMLSLFFGCAMLLGARYGWRAMLLLGVPLVPVGMLLIGGRMASFSASEGTGQTRVQVWADGLEQLRDSPLFGIGFNELGNVVGKAAHNSFINAYAETGLLGGTLFFATFFFAFVTLLRLLKYQRALCDPSMRRLLPCLLAILASFTVGVMTLSRTESVTTYMVLGLVTAFMHVATIYTPALAVRIDTRLVQRMALSSVGLLLALYMFVRVFRA
jgi:O-antigen ligase